MEVEIKLTVYEKNGDKTGIDGPEVRIRSHWNQNGPNGLVVIQTPDGEFTVSGRDLERAADRCLDVK